MHISVLKTLRHDCRYLKQNQSKKYWGKVPKTRSEVFSHSKRATLSQFWSGVDLEAAERTGVHKAGRRCPQRDAAEGRGPAVGPAGGAPLWPESRDPAVHHGCDPPDQKLSKSGAAWTAPPEGHWSFSLSFDARAVHLQKGCDSTRVKSAVIRAISRFRRPLVWGQRCRTEKR